MARRRLATGEVVEVPDGLTEGGVQDWLMQQGATPQQVGITPEQPELPGVPGQMAIGVQRFLSERGALPQGQIMGIGPGTPDLSIPPPETLATSVGQAAIPMAAGMALGMVPGLQGAGAQMALQGGAAAGLDLLRDDADVRSAGAQGALAAGVTGATGLTGRMLSTLGRSGVFKAPTDSAASLAQFSRGAGGLNFADKIHKRLLSAKVGQIFGFTDDQVRAFDDVGEDFLLAARTKVDDTYNAANPLRPVKVDQVVKEIDALPEAARSTRVNDVLEALRESPEGIPAARWQPIQRALREETSSLQRNLAWGHKAGNLEKAVDALDTAAAASGGDKAALGLANQRFKILATLEEINAVVSEGEIPAGQLLRMLGRENFKGFGRRAIAEGASKNLIPEIDELMKLAKSIDKFNRATAGGSATAGRLGAFQAPLTGLQRAVQGDLIGAAAQLGKGGVARFGGRAALGETTAAGRRLAGAAGQFAGESADEPEQ